MAFLHLRLVLHTVKMSFAYTQAATVMKLFRLLHSNRMEYVSAVSLPDF